MTSRHADGHRIHMFPWVSNSFSRQQANPATQNVNRTFPLEATGDAWLLAKRSHSFSNFQRLIFSGMFGCGTKAPCQCRISVKSSVVPWFTKELQIGIGEWMSTSCGIVESYIYIYMYYIDIFFETVLQKMLTGWPVFLFWGLFLHDLFLWINDILITADEQWHPYTPVGQWFVRGVWLIFAKQYGNYHDPLWESIMRIHYENPMQSQLGSIKMYKAMKEVLKSWTQFTCLFF